jgi:hypothetical protein
MERPRSGTERTPCCRRAHRPQADHATSRIGHETAPNRLSRLLPHRGFHLGAEGLSARNRRFESISLQQRVPANPLIAARESTGRGRFIMWDRVPPRLLFDGPRVRSTSLPSSLQSEGVTARPPTGRLPIRGRREAMIVRSLRRSRQSQRRSSRRPRGGWCRSGAASALHRRSPAR